MRAVGSIDDDRREPAADLTFLCLMMAEDFLVREYRHPVAAALALAARGVTGLERPAFAERFDRTEDEVAATEGGSVAFTDLPVEVGDLLESSQKYDLLQLADLDRAFSRLAVRSSLESASWTQGQFAGLAVYAGASSRR
jgi:hypothetical protein